MIYKMKIADSVVEMVFDLLEVPIEDKDIEGTADNTTIDGNVFTDYLWLKKQFTQKWSLMCKDDYTKLRGFYTRQWENAEVPTYKLYVGNDIRETKSASGNPFQITNNTEYDAPILDFKLNGNTEQDGTPTPDSPVSVETVSGEQVVKVEGKNLFDKATATQGKFINASGIITNDATALVSDYIHIEPNTDYYVSGRTLWNSIALYDGSKTFIERRNLSYVNGVINITNTACAYIRINASIGDLNNIQLELGNQATTYEAYRGTDYEVNLGKNLFDTSTATLVNKYANTNGSMASAPDWLGIDSYFEVQPNTTYTFSAKNQGARFLWNEYSAASEASFISPRHESTGTFTTGSSTHYIRFSTNNANATNLQIERSSTATTYAPYITPIELCKIGTYQDYIWNDNGTWKVHQEVGKVVLDGTENGWILGQSLTNTTHFTMPDYTTLIPNAVVPTSETQIGNAVSDYFTEIGNLYNVDSVGMDLHANKNLILGVLNATATTLPNFKTWLGTNKPSIYCALATATDTAITESALITQLNAIVQASLPVGLNNVSNISITPNLAGEMVLTYELIHEKETIIRDTTPVRLTLTDGGVINPCECRQNVQITMRETTQ